MLALTSTAAVAVKSHLSALGLHRGAGLRITAMPRPGDGHEFELTPSAAPGANDRVVRGDDALVFVDPPASAALEDALLDARDPGGARSASPPTIETEGRLEERAHARRATPQVNTSRALGRVRRGAPASLRDALLRQRGPLPVAYERMRTRWIREAGGERRTPARASAVAGRPSGRAWTRPRCGPGRFSPS